MADPVPYFGTIELEAGRMLDPFTFEHAWHLGANDSRKCGFEADGFVDQRPAFGLEGGGRGSVIRPH